MICLGCATLPSLCRVDFSSVVHSAAVATTSARACCGVRLAWQRQRCCRSGGRASLARAVIVLQCFRRARLAARFLCAASNTAVIAAARHPTLQKKKEKEQDGTRLDNISPADVRQGKIRQHQKGDTRKYKTR